MKLFYVPIFLLIAGLVSSCEKPAAQHQEDQSKQTKDDPTLYKEAIIDASKPEKEEISYQLTKLTEDNPKLEWHNGAVKVVTWTNWDGYLQLIDSTISTTRDTWVTAAPSLKSFAQQVKLSKGDPISSMEKVLGLPPQSGKKYFVTIWVKPSDVFRPCLDPEVTDDHCEISLDKLDAPIDSAHLAWIESLQSSSYDTLKGYPWTQLGYTYDWEDNGKEIGLSEFVIKPSSFITIDQVETLEQFIQ